jgi:hypothetical protein
MRPTSSWGSDPETGENRPLQFRVIVRSGMASLPPSGAARLLSSRDSWRWPAIDPQLAHTLLSDGLTGVTTVSYSEPDPWPARGSPR